MNDDHIRYEELAAAYALGLLNRAETAEFQAHLDTICPDCEAELAANAKLAAELAHAAPALPVPEGLKEKVLTRLQSQSPRVSSAVHLRERASIWPKLAFGFGIAASLLAVYSGFTANNLSKEVQKLTAEINGLRQQLTSTQARLAFALSPMNEVLELAGQKVTPNARGRVIFNAARGDGFFTAGGLPPAPGDKTYQLWVIAGGKAVSVDVFKVDSSGAVEIKMTGLPPTEQIAAFAVTLEPAGGVPQPTGEKYLVGALSKI
jgi:anti-sigma-K factor RskA